LRKIADHHVINVDNRIYLKLGARTDLAGGSLELIGEEQLAVTRIAGDADQRLGYAPR